MAFQTWKQHQLGRNITTTNRQSVNDQAGAAKFNNPVQIGKANPLATAVENPSLGMNHMFLVDSNNMVIQARTNPTTTTHSGPANSLPDDRRKRPRVSTENQVENFNFNFNFPLPYSAFESITNDMIALKETDRKLCQQTKRVRTQFAEKQNQAVGLLVDSARAPILKKLKERDEEIFNMLQLNMELQENIKNLFHQNQVWREHATACEIKAMSLGNDLEDAQAEVRRLKGIVRSYGAVAAPHEEQDLKSYCESNISGKNITQRNAQGWIRAKVVDVTETAAKKVHTGASEMGEGSGENKMCKACGEMEMTFLAMPCMHLCFCVVCGTQESRLPGPCPVCASTMTTTTAINLM